jgi:hypothetical protein
MGIIELCYQSDYAPAIPQAEMSRCGAIHITGHILIFATTLSWQIYAIDYS